MCDTPHCRVRDYRHSTYDVLGGFVLGAVVTIAVVTRYQALHSLKGKKLEVAATMC